MDIGFDEELLYDLFRMRYFHWDRQAQFSMKAMLKYDKKDKYNYTISIYNKFMYYLLIKCLKSSIGFQLSGLFNNHNQYVQQQLQMNMEKGMTRVELRFNHYEFRATGYYTK